MYESDQDLQLRREENERKLVAFQDLAKSDGYRMLVELFKSRLINYRAEMISTDINSTEQAFAAAKLRGRIIELEALMTLPEFVLDNIQADLQTIYHEQASRAELNDGEK